MLDHQEAVGAGQQLMVIIVSSAMAALAPIAVVPQGRAQRTARTGLVEPFDPPVAALAGAVLAMLLARRLCRGAQHTHGSR